MNLYVQNVEQRLKTIAFLNAIKIQVVCVVRLDLVIVQVVEERW